MSIDEHPCFSAPAHFRSARVHLPVAPACNIQCNYCDRTVSDCVHSSRPGLTARIMREEEALEHVAAFRAREPRLRVVGIAGPGEPLYNDASFRVLRAVGERFPDVTLCLSTNGLLLPRVLPQLLDIGVGTLTVTINASSPQVAQRIYRGVDVDHLLAQQLLGIEQAAACGLAVKVNTVLIPGVNDGQVVDIARRAARAGARLQNIIPLIPIGRFSAHVAPTPDQLHQLRQLATVHLEQFYHCRQCRADAMGVPGEMPKALP